jgi:aspartyl-tRNA(Asn)/glutamyl-tRNA(Gln) amidotransferase subunit B
MPTTNKASKSSASPFTLTVGLEIHAELATSTKMFCACVNAPHETAPNTHLCPVCTGQPGALPTINKEAVFQVLRVGHALGGTLADFSEFDRKNYFYPDLPKGYQISQFEYPLVRGGTLAGVAITRIHLEEDTARSSHHSKGSVVDFNRAGVPLLELVTEPVIHTASTAGTFAREFQLLLRYLGASTAHMERGEMRVEANISVSDTDILGTKVEVKNINSFRAMERAIEYEVARHRALYAEGRGGELVQETRGWDESTQATLSQRKKEGSGDYRYFPDPDIPKMVISDIPEFSESALKKSMPVLPNERRERYRTLGLKDEDCETLVTNRALAGLFDSLVQGFPNDPEKIRLATNYITSDVRGLLTGESDTTLTTKITVESLTELVEMIARGALSSRGAKDVLALLHEQGGNAEAHAKEAGLLQESSHDALEALARTIMNENKSIVAEYKGGKENVFQFLIGQGMKVSKGKANPTVLREVFLRLLAE